VPAKLADVFRAYVKPSLGGAVIIRKRGVVRKSEKVMEINDVLRFADYKPASVAKILCLISMGKDVAGMSAEELKTTHCPFEKFRQFEKWAMVIVAKKTIESKNLTVPEGYRQAIENQYNSLPEEIKNIVENQWSKITSAISKLKG